MSQVPFFKSILFTFKICQVLPTVPVSAADRRAESEIRQEGRAERMSAASMPIGTEGLQARTHPVQPLNEGQNEQQTDKQTATHSIGWVTTRTLSAVDQAGLLPSRIKKVLEQVKRI